jgi:ubiquinone/menaquinone biosynthesis C-methylase UbiE
VAHVCPWWFGYFLTNPLRRLLEKPERILASLVDTGMLVLEPGPGMGYLTLELARRVGPSGRVVAVDLQERMLDALRRRARRAGVLDRIDTRLARPGETTVADLAGRCDLAIVFYMLHEVDDKEAFLRDVRAALKPGGRLLLTEPKVHVSAQAFAASVDLARSLGFVASGIAAPKAGHSVILEKPRQ